MSGGLFEFGTHASDMGAMFYVSLPFLTEIETIVSLNAETKSSRSVFDKV